MLRPSIVNKNPEQDQTEGSSESETVTEDDLPWTARRAADEDDAEDPGADSSLATKGEAGRPTADPVDDETSKERSSRQVLTIQRATWELELLISGAVIFSLFQLPSLLTSWFLGVNVHLSRDHFFGPFFLYYGSTLVVIALIVGFGVHFLARGFWVAICGLNEAFPDGIVWDKLDVGPLSKRFAGEHMLTPKVLERSADRFASSIFSVLLVLICVMTCVMGVIGGTLFVVTAVVRSFFPDLHILVVLYSGLFLVACPGLLSGVLDAWFKKKPERLKTHPRLAKWGYRLMKFNYFWVAQHVYGSIPLTFQSHWSTRKVSLGFGLATFALAGIFIFGFIVQAGIIGWDSYDYLPSQASEETLNADHYEDRRDPKSRRRVPVIESEVVKGPYLRLYIPFRPMSDNELLEWSCPGLEPVHSGGLFLTPRAESRSETIDFAPLRTCLARVWTVEIDGAKRNMDYVFYRHPTRKTAGVLAHIPTQRLEVGRHQLVVRMGPPELPGGEELAEGAPSVKVHRFDFWK